MNGLKETSERQTAVGFACSQCDSPPLPLIRESPLWWVWGMSQRSAVATTPFLFLSLKPIVVFLSSVCCSEEEAADGSRRAPARSASAPLSR